MKLQTNPSLRLIEKVERLGFRKTDRYFVDSHDHLALLVSRGFHPIKYIGVATIQSHRMKMDEVYYFLSFECGYSGELIKKTVRILGKKRVGIFIHTSQTSDYHVLILQTKEGAIAIAPRIGASENIPYGAQDMKPLKDYFKKPNGKLLRNFCFGRI